MEFSGIRREIASLESDTRAQVVGAALQELAAATDRNALAIEDVNESIKEIHATIKNEVKDIRDELKEWQNGLDNWRHDTEAKISDIHQCRHEHEKTIVALEEHLKNDISIEHWLGKRATAIIKAVLVFIGGALMAYVWKRATGM